MKFKEAQRVWSPMNGLGTVEAIREDRSHSVVVHFDTGGMRSYTGSGRYFENDLLPTLFLDEVSPWPDPPAHRPDLKMDQPIWVRNDQSDAWLPKHFAGWDENNKVMAWCWNGTSHSANRGYSYEHYSLENPDARHF